MAIHAIEGKLVYALVRALRPMVCIEVGTADGGSATHILAALAANGEGELISYDIDAGVGSRIPAALRDRWTLRVVDGRTADYPEYADFIFEDASHDYATTYDLLGLLKTRRPRIILSHDYYTHRVYGGFFVEQAFNDALGSEAFGVELDGAFTGLGVWVNPNRPQAAAPLLKAETAALINGHELEVNGDGSTKIKRKHAPDTQTREPRKAKAKAKP
jgi:hypothetical protein